MPSTYSPDLRIELIANKKKSGTWGTITNDNLGVIIEDAISGLASVTTISANQALTAQNGAVDQARCAALSLDTTTGANFAVYVPPVTKLYVVQNASSYTVTVYASTVLGNTTAAGTGVAIPTGKSVLLRCDGTNIVEQLNHVVGAFSVGGNLSVTGTTTLTGAATAPTPTFADSSTKIATTAFVQAALAAVYPVGSIYINATSATNPATLLGFGTWVAFGAGRVMVGLDAGNAAFDTAEETGGSADAITVSHTHTASVTDAGHRHNTTLDGVVSTSSGFQSQIGLTTYNTASGGFEGYYSRGIADSTQANASTSSTATTGITVSNSTEGSSGTNANLVPYFALAFIMKA